MTTDSFEDITVQMGALLDKLRASCAYRKETLKCLTVQCGVYVFYEDGKEIYVGRSQSVKKRIQQHFSASEKGAPLAFRFLKEDLGLATGQGAPYTSKQLAEKYKSEFKERKQRVSKMEVRAVEIMDCTTSTESNLF